MPLCTLALAKLKSLTSGAAGRQADARGQAARVQRRRHPADQGRVRRQEAAECWAGRGGRAVGRILAGAVRLREGDRACCCCCCCGRTSLCYNVTSHQASFGRVLAQGVFKSDSDAKPLTEKRPWAEDPEGQLSELTCYPYTIAEGPGAAQKKGPRVEDYKWSVYPGSLHDDSFSYRLNKKRSLTKYAYGRAGICS